eukprot:g12214.t1
MRDITAPSSTHPGKAALALLLLVPAPSIGVLFAMHLMPDTAVGKSIHLAAKVWLFSFPILWLLLIERIKPRLPRWSWDGMGAGFITGGLILAIIIGAWEHIGTSLVDVNVFKEGMDKVGLDTPLKFLGFAAAVTFINALLEEYVWRWFVYSKWFALLKGLNLPAKAVVIPGAIALAGVCFVLHHSLAMHVYFGFTANALASLGIFIGGVTWSIIYLKYRNIYSAYVSHIFADIALFYVGYRVAFGSMNDSTTNVAELKQLVADFVAERDWQRYHVPKHLVMSIMIEAAELMEHFQWVGVESVEDVKADAERMQQVREELSDVLAYTLSLANALDIDVSSAYEAKMKKNATKYPADEVKNWD